MGVFERTSNVHPTGEIEQWVPSVKIGEMKESQNNTIVDLLY